MRQIVLDTETTGLSPDSGHRLIEIGALEIVNHVPTGAVFHHYIDPERDVPEDAFRIHGISSEFLAGKPKFADIVSDFLDFIGDAPLVIHNAAFDMGFLNWELKRTGLAELAAARAVDTLLLARSRFPGAQNSLDALCRRFNIDNSSRVKHGALLDAELLAEVYLELMGGKQPILVLGMESVTVVSGGQVAVNVVRLERPVALPPRLTEEERVAHRSFIDELGGETLWPRP